MNYARIMELPLTLRLLQASREDTILDVSSPKLLAMYFALNGYDGVVAADLEDYFLSDFEAYKKHGNISIQTAVFDAAREIPYPDAHFDKIFSVSVLEHIPDDGDILAVREMLRVMKPSGSLVITLPAFAYYVEEWTSSKSYWKSVHNEEGKTFFQRRYDHETLLRKFEIPGARLEEIILIAEKPIEQPRIGGNGIMLHNCYYIDRVRIPHLLKALSRRLKYFPFLGYLAEHIVSRKCHYMTTDWKDPNIRQVVVKMTKTTGSEQSPAGDVPKAAPEE
jgi:SAM-dependent methyltransferase